MINELLVCLLSLLLIYLVWNSKRSAHEKDLERTHTLIKKHKEEKHGQEDKESIEQRKRGS